MSSAVESNEGSNCIAASRIACPEEVYSDELGVFIGSSSDGCLCERLAPKLISFPAVALELIL
jgi:hypothetical protein